MEKYNSKKFGDLHISSFVYTCKKCEDIKYEERKYTNCDKCIYRYCEHFENMFFLCPKCYDNSYIADNFERLERSIKLYRKTIRSLRKKVRLLENHIRYAPGGEGALEALESFNSNGICESLEKNED